MDAGPRSRNASPIPLIERLGITLLLWNAEQNGPPPPFRVTLVLPFWGAFLWLFFLFLLWIFKHKKCLE